MDHDHAFSSFPFLCSFLFFFCSLPGLSMRDIGQRVGWLLFPRVPH